MPKRQKEIQVKPLNEDDLQYWAEQILFQDAGEEDEHKTEQLAHRVANLADLTSLIDYMFRVRNQEQYQVMMKQAKDIGVLKQIIVSETDITPEEIEEHESDFSQQLEMDMKAEEKLRELKAKGEEPTEEDLKEIFEELSKETEDHKVNK